MLNLCSNGKWVRDQQWVQQFLLLQRDPGEWLQQGESCPLWGEFCVPPELPGQKEHPVRVTHRGCQGRGFCCHSCSSGSLWGNNLPALNPTPRRMWFAPAHIQKAAHHASQMEKRLIRGSLRRILRRGELMLLARVNQGVGKYTEFNFLLLFYNFSQFSQNRRMNEVGKDFEYHHAQPMFAFTPGEGN